MSIPMRVIPGYHNDRPGIQVGTKLVATGQGGTYTAEDYRHLRQMGVTWVMVDGPVGPPDAKVYREIRLRVEGEGLKVYRLSNHACHNMDSITLNLPDREEKLRQYLAYIRALGEAGIYYATYAHMANGIWRSGPTRVIRGGERGSGLDLASPDMTGFWMDVKYTGPLTHGRAYSQEELWDNYEYFIRRVVPVAEDAGVYIGIHPDDPPACDLGGIPRRIFGTFEGYRRAIDMAGSPNIGVCLCCGCWLEGGDRTGADVYEMIRYFSRRNRLFKLHVRNVTNPLFDEGGFAETYPNDGCGDVVEILKVLDETGFDGCIMNDHLPPMVGGWRASESFQTAYLMGVADTFNQIRYGKESRPSGNEKP